MIVNIVGGSVFRPCLYRKLPIEPQSSGCVSRQGMEIVLATFVLGRGTLWTLLF